MPPNPGSPSVPAQTLRLNPYRALPVGPEADAGSGTLATRNPLHTRRAQAHTPEGTRASTQQNMARRAALLSTSGKAAVGIALVGGGSQALDSNGGHALLTGGASLLLEVGQTAISHALKNTRMRIAPKLAALPAFGGVIALGMSVADSPLAVDFWASAIALGMNNGINYFADPAATGASHGVQLNANSFTKGPVGAVLLATGAGVALMGGKASPIGSAVMGAGLGVTASTAIDWAGRALSAAWSPSAPDEEAGVRNELDEIHTANAAGQTPLQVPAQAHLDDRPARGRVEFVATAAERP